MSFGNNWNAFSDAEARKSRDAADAQARQAEQRRLEMQQWERDRQLVQEGILQQEQSRRSRESDGRLSNELNLGTMGEETKRQVSSQNAQTAMYGFDRMASMFGDKPAAPAINLHGQSGKRIGGTYPPSLGTGPIGSGGYAPQGFSIRQSLLRN